MRIGKKFIKDGQVYQVRKNVCGTIIALNLSSEKVVVVRFSECELSNAKWLM